MDLRDAANAFIGGWTATRRLSGPFQADQIEEATWLNDPTGRRMGELVGVDLPPERLVELYPTGKRGAISSMLSDARSIDEDRRQFRELGWRLLRTEPAFVHRLVNLPETDSRIRRVRSWEEVVRVCKSEGKKPERLGVEDTDDAEIRLYEAREGGEHAGWVRSIRTGPDAWVSSLKVSEPFRRRGLGFGLMASLLADDARLARRASVLLASHAGAQLYPRLGYEQVGTLLLLIPIKKRPVL